MLTGVMILANRGVAWGAMAIAGFILLPVLMNLIFGFGSGKMREIDPHDSIGTKLRRFRDSKTVRCPRNDCQAWNPKRARYCRICGCGMD